LHRRRNLGTTRLPAIFVALQRVEVHESLPRATQPPREIVMTLTAAHLSPLVAIIAGILILLIPRLLNYIVALYLIIFGVMGLNSIHHFIR
jgi:Protein of unknown function (DUF3096)